MIFCKNSPSEFISTERDSTHLDWQRCNLLISENLFLMWQFLSITITEFAFKHINEVKNQDLDSRRVFIEKTSSLIFSTLSSN